MSENIRANSFISTSGSLAVSAQWDIASPDGKRALATSAEFELIIDYFAMQVALPATGLSNESIAY